jgi:predicted membrane protein
MFTSFTADCELIHKALNYTYFDLKQGNLPEKDLGEFFMMIKMKIFGFVFSHTSYRSAKQGAVRQKRRAELCNRRNEQKAISNTDILNVRREMIKDADTKNWVRNDKN